MFVYIFVTTVKASVKNFSDKIWTFVTLCYAVHYRCIFQEQPGCKPIGENFLPIYKTSYFILRCKCKTRKIWNIGKFFSYLITSIIDLRGDQIKAPSKLMPHDIQDDRWRSTMLLIIIEQNSKKYHKHSIFKLLWKYHFTTSKAQKFKHLKNTRQNRMSISVKIQMRLFGVIFKHFDNKEDA